MLSIVYAVCVLRDTGPSDEPHIASSFGAGILDAHGHVPLDV